MHCKALVAGLAISASTIIMADSDTDWQCLTNAINASFDLNPSNRTDVQRHLSSMPGEMRPAFRTNVMERASLSVREAEILFTQ